MKLSDIVDKDTDLCEIRSVEFETFMTLLSAEQSSEYLLAQND